MADAKASPNADSRDEGVFSKTPLKELFRLVKTY